jgi:predicted acyl esterase
MGDVPGHRIRWQISGGTHPRYAHNPGTGESPVDATTFTPVRITLHTDSALVLPSSSGLASFFSPPGNG